MYGDGIRCLNCYKVRSRYTDRRVQCEREIVKLLGPGDYRELAQAVAYDVSYKKLNQRGFCSAYTLKTVMQACSPHRYLLPNRAR